MQIRRVLPAVLFSCALVTAPAVCLSAPLPAQEKVEAARRAVTAGAGYQSHHDLARALIQLARDSGDASHYAEAQRALAEAALLVPGNLETESIAVAILLGKREFGAALERARALNRKVPDDLAVYGHIVDAASALGKYDEAERAAQWMLDLRSNAVLALTRAAYLREVFGDVDGAIDLMQRVYTRIAPDDIEERAWHLARMARMLAGAGRTAAAEAAALAALSLAPNYYPAVEQLARVRLMQGRPAEAVALETQRLQSVRRPETAYALARALAAAGREKDARAAFAVFERDALARVHEVDNANRELVFYYVDYARKPRQALAIATREIERTRDVRTVEAYAWALQANGKAGEARRQIESLMADGVCDAAMLQRVSTLAVRKSGLAHAPRSCADSSLQAASTQTTRTASRAARTEWDGRRSPR
jgi:tetratricopeptide (TPR) repeat protein